MKDDSPTTSHDLDVLNMGETEVTKILDFETNCDGWHGTAFARPSYDCITKPCGKNGCVEGKPRHGRHGEEWVFRVRSDAPAFGLALTVYTQIGIEKFWNGRSAPDAPEGAWLAVHSVWPLNDEQLISGKPDELNCDVIHAPCFAETLGGIEAKAFWEKVGDNTKGLQQGPAFWSRFASRAQDVLAVALVQRDRMRCPTCSGLGIVCRVQS